MPRLVILLFQRQEESLKMNNLDFSVTVEMKLLQQKKNQ